MGSKKGAKTPAERNVSRKALAGSVKAKPAAARVAKESRRAPAAASPRQAAEAPAAFAAQALVSEIRSLRSLVESRMGVPTEVGAVLEDSVSALRRLLSEALERHLESVVGKLAALRRAAAQAATSRTDLVARLDALLGDLGAVRFDGKVMDAVDPLIHTVLEERRITGMPDGVIAEALQPGFRTGRGLLLAKAGVAINRKA